MKFRKPWAFLFLMGLMIHAMSAPPAPLQASVVHATETRDPAGRGSLPSVSQESESIDSFNVHPENRWSESETGSFEDDLENGEFKFKGFGNDSASMYRYRDAETTSGDIETRWRLNALADFETNDTDFATQAGNWGPDGWGFEEGDLDGTTDNNFVVTVAGGILNANVDGAPGSASIHTAVTGISANIWDYLQVRMKSNVADIKIKINDDTTATIGAFQTITTSFANYTWDFSGEAQWTDMETFLTLLFDEDGGDGVLEDTDEVDIDFIWLLGQPAGDFEIPLIGLNVTTDEGSGNSSLNAYPWNSTHYILRPAFTTDDGTAWRSWNIESDYQDFAQMMGEQGADGWDFVETGNDGWVDFSGGTVTTSDLGWINVSAAAPDALWGTHRTSTVTDISTSDFNYAHFKLKAGGADVTNFRFIFILTGGTTKSITVEAGAIETDWTIYSVNLTANADWVAAGVVRRDMQLRFATAASGWVLIDYIRLTSNNDSSDLTFFEYETYYRAKMKYDLMESTLNWKISDDSDDKLASTVQGNFKIEDFFDEDELIRDISLGTVGDLDYFFGLRSAGANATTWWDFYKADFTEFNFQKDSAFTDNIWFVGDGSPLATWFAGNGSLGVHKTIGWNLTVPEFDGFSGKIVLDEITNSTSTDAVIQIAVGSVFTNNGTFFQILSFSQGDSTFFGNGTPVAITPASAHRMRLQFNQTAALSQTWTTSGGVLDKSQVSFAVNYDKQRHQLMAQFSFLNASGAPRTIAFSSLLATELSNEFVIQIRHFSGIDGGGGASGAEEVFLSIESWDLVFRDIFGGIPVVGPALDEVFSGAGDALPSDPIGFLIQAFRDLAGIMGGVLEAIVANGAVITSAAVTLTNILTQVTSAATDLATMVTSLATIITNTGSTVTNLASVITNTAGLVADMASLITNTGGLVADFTSLLTDTGLMLTDLGNIVTGVSDLPADFISLLSDTADLLTNLEDVFDALVDVLGDSWLGQIFAELVALAVDVGTAVFDEFISRALAIMTDVYTGLLNFIRSITVAGVSIGDVIDFIDSWMVNFWNIADSIISLGTQILTVWTQVFLMGLLGIILIWAAASAKQDGALFTEKFTAAMNFDVNPIGFILTIRIPLGVILLGNLFWVVFTAYDWEGFLIPAVVIASFQLGAYEIPDYSDAMDDFFEYTSSVLEDILDILLDEVAGDIWKTLVTLLTSDILGVAPEIIVFVVTAGTAAMILLKGRF